MSTKIRIVVFGPPTVGKTTLISSFGGGQFLSERDVNVGRVVIKPYVVGNRVTKLSVLDAGTEITGLHDEFIQHGECFIFVFSVLDASTLKSAEELMGEVKSKRGDVPLVLVGNKTDEQPRLVTKDDGEKVAAKLGAEYFETAAADNDGVEEVFATAASKVKPNHTLAETAANGDFARMEKIYNKMLQEALLGASTKETAGFLIGKGANPLPEDNSVLCAAAQGGHADVVALLLEMKAPPEKGEVKPVAWAASSGSAATVKLLLAAKATADAEDSTYTSTDAPVHKAAASNSVEVMKVLIDAKADINRPDQWGCTALHVAAQCGDDSTELVKLLLASGADKSLKDEAGKTALDHAGDDPVIAALLK